MSQIFKLKNGTQFLITEAPGGIYNSLQLKKISELCNRDLAIVKATEDQRIGLFVKEEEAESVVTELQSVGLGLRKYQQGLHQPVSCIGELCEEHEQDALGASMDLTKELAEIQLSTPLRIGINGCARCCTPCHTLDISIIGEALGYRISLGGKGSQIPELAAFMAEGVPPQKLPTMVKNLVMIYHNHAGPGESLQEVIERCGVQEFVEALAPYSQDAAHADDPLDLARQVAAGESNLDFADDGQLAADPMDMENLSLDDDLDGEVLESLADDFNEEAIDEDTELSASEDESYVADMDEDSLDITEDEELVNSTSPEDDILEFDGNLVDDLNDDLSPAEDTASDSDPSDVDIDDDIDLNDLEEIPIETNMENRRSAGSDLGEATDNEDLEIDQDDLEKLDMESLAPDLDEGLDEKTAIESAADLDNDDPLSEDYGDAERLSEEDELSFEQRLSESIAEEAALIASEEKDLNEDDRQAALGMLEAGSYELSEVGQDTASAEREFDESSFDNLDELDSLPEEEIELAAPISVAAKSRAEHLDRKATGKAKFFNFSGMDLIEQDKVHLTFDSGAYIEIDISSLENGQQKVISMGGQSFVLVKTSEGVLLEVDGVRLFYPVNEMQAAS